MNSSIDERMVCIAKNNRNPFAKKPNLQIWDTFREVIRLYLSGRHAEAFQMFYELFLEHVEKLRLSTIKKDECFYRMRIGHNAYEEFRGKNEMFHIPFECSHLVGNERYSISGFPSLYLGSSAYVCWEEIRRPDINYVNTALFKAAKTTKVIDMTIKDRYRFNDERFSDCLVLACSIPVQYPSAPFKPEYIIPQMLLHSLVKYNQDKTDENEISGIKYSSTHIKDSNLWINFPTNRTNRKLFENYVFPAFDRKESGISDKLDKLFDFHNCITYNKMMLMYPDREYDRKDRYGSCAFGKIEQLLNGLPLASMLTYDGSLRP